MAQLFSSDETSIKSENVTLDEFWSEEHDRIPLKQRLKLLLASRRISGFCDNGFEQESAITVAHPTDIVIKKEVENCDYQGCDSVCAAENGRNERFSLDESNAGALGEYNCEGTHLNEPISLNEIPTSEVHDDTVTVEKGYAKPSSTTLFQCLMPPEYPVKVKVEFNDDILMNSSENGLMGASGVDLEATKMKIDTPNDFEDGLDHVPLNERWRMLLSRKSLELTKPHLKGNTLGLSNSVIKDMVNGTVEVGHKVRHFGDGTLSLRVNPTCHIPKRKDSACKSLQSGLLNSSISGSSCSIPEGSSIMGSCQVTESSKSEKLMGFQKNGSTHSSKTTTLSELHSGQIVVSGDTRKMHNSVFGNIKVEPVDNNEIDGQNKNALGDFLVSNRVPVKSELDALDMCYGDALDHMLLSDRVKLLVSREVPDLDIARKSKCLGKITPSFLDCGPIASDKPPKIKRPRKRRKTATDSVETALEEDAPGLLQVLIGKGVLANEMKLYGEMESDEALDDSLSDDSFSELEAVISKIFFQRHSMLKLPPIRCTGGEKTSYCLACLISLVEQARYLQFRKWPVEWGWCRDLQSFIFVFEKHNRIVLERPEYGYATYFFELVDSLPVDWQIKRLVTAMKLPNCSRFNLLENKALVVGEDLSEGEARVLMGYGWTPNSGLGTMLNYCDRVVHDRRNENFETDGSEWRSKIGKLLTNGYNGGTIVSTNIPKKFVELSASQSPQVKLELQ